MDDLQMYCASFSTAPKQSVRCGDQEKWTRTSLHDLKPHSCEATEKKKTL